MTTLHSTRLLRISLLADAAASGATGLLLAFGSGPLAPLLGLPEALLRGAGLVLLPYAVLVALAGRSTAPAFWQVGTIVAANLVWAADSVLLLVVGPSMFGLGPTTLGIAFVLAQAAVVLGFGILQAVATRGAMPGVSVQTA